MQDLEHQQQEESASKIRFNPLGSGFIPFACHYNDSTILNKNGDLVQVIHLRDFTPELLSKGLFDMRALLRQVVISAINNNRYISIWLHTTRATISLDGQSALYKNQFAAEVHNKWVAKHYWDDKFVNEIYISLVYNSPEIMNINDLSNLGRGISFLNNKALMEAKLEENSRILTSISQKIINELTPYGGRLLGIKNVKGILYSDLLRFFNYLISGSDAECVLPCADLSEYLAYPVMANAASEMEIRSELRNLFVSIFSIKEYEEQSLENIDILLQLPLEFVITESITFSLENNKLYEDLEYKKYIASLGTFNNLKGTPGFDYLDSKRELYSHQITISVIASKLAKLRYDVGRVSEVLLNLGFMVVKEDINLESCFWAQLPGNFSFRKRIIPSFVKYLMAFASMHYYQVGALNNKWGKAVTLMRSVSGTPYFFNFHNGDNGHTLINGAVGSGRSTITNFLLSESMKYEPRLLIIDVNNESASFIKAIGGEYGVSGEHLLPIKYEHQHFIAQWLQKILNNFYEIDKSATLAKESITQVFAQSLEKHNLKKLLEILGNLAQGLRDDIGEYFTLLEKLSAVSANSICGIDVTDIMHSPRLLELAISYITFQFQQSLDGRPAIIVFKDILKHVSIDLQKYLDKWLDDLIPSNAIAIFVSNISGQEVNNRQFYNMLVQKLATQVYLADGDVNQANYMSFLKLTNKQLETIKTLRKISRNMLVIQNGVNITLENSLAGIGEALNVLTNSKSAS
jgi:type IV secretion/conjugal transfer VirB4 family ATPase